MARFAQYYIKYHHDFAPHDWEKRQEHFDALFEKDESITFGVGEPSDEQKAKGEQYAKTYKHRVYHLPVSRDASLTQSKQARFLNWSRACLLNFTILLRLFPFFVDSYQKSFRLIFPSNLLIFKS